MTKEERENAIRCLKLWVEREPQLQTYKTALEALEQYPILDKIRAEIEKLDGKYVIGDYGIYGENTPKYVRLCEVLQIIDKYRAENEE